MKQKPHTVSGRAAVGVKLGNWLTLRGSWCAHGGRIGGQPLHADKTPICEFGNVCWFGKVGFALRLDARNPTPAKRVDRRIAVQQMPQEEIRP